MRLSSTRVSALSLAALLSLSSASSAQDFSLDDCPNAPIGPTAPVPGLCGAEAPWGVGPFLAPSPTLGVFGWADSDILVPPPALDVPMFPPIHYLNALSANHWQYSHKVWPGVRLRFSIDRVTGGVPGSASAAQFVNNQQPADIYDSTRIFQHPCAFVGTLPGGPYAGILPTAGGGGGNVLAFNQSFFGLTAAGLLVGPAVMVPPIGPGSHDNIDAYNDLPVARLDTDGNGITNFDFYYSTYPAEVAASGIPPADIFGVPAFAAPPGVPYAPAPTMGLDVFTGPRTDDIDGLVVWASQPLPHPAVPALDCAIFSLSPGSGTLATLQGMGVPANADTIFMTDFTGAFAIYAFGGDIGVAPAATGFPPNVDGLEIRR